MNKHTTSVIVMAIALVAAPRFAGATKYLVQVGGSCTTGGGQATLYAAGYTSVRPWVDQRNNISTAAANLAQAMNTYCTGNNSCVIATHSHGGAVVSKMFAMYSNNWNIVQVTNAGSSAGGSELASISTWVARVFLGCALADDQTPTNYRGSWNHNDTNGENIYNLSGRKDDYYNATAPFLPGGNDGAVAFHSSGAFVSSWSISNLCSYQGYHWQGNYVYGTTCDGEDATHSSISGTAQYLGWDKHPNAFR